MRDCLKREEQKRKWEILGKLFLFYVELKGENMIPFIK